MKYLILFRTLTSYVSLLSLFLCLIFFGCKKPKQQPGVLQTSIKLTSSQNIYYPFELGEFKLTGTSNLPDSIKGTISGVAITLFKDDSVFVCLIPDIAVGKHNLKTTINGQAIEAALEIQAIMNVVNADSYVKEYIDRSTVTTNLILKIADSLRISSVTNSLKEDVNKILAFNNTLKTQMQSLSIAEKEKVARFLTINGLFMRALDSITLSLSKHSIILARITSVEDYEKEVEKLMVDYTKAVIEVGFSAKKVAIRLALIALASAVAPPLGAIGAGIVIGEYLNNLAVVVATQEKLLNTAFKPFENLSSNRINGSANYKISANVFQKNVPQFLNVNMKYRTVTNDDLKTSTGSLIVSFLAKCVELRSIYYEFINELPSYLKPSTTCTDINTLVNYKSATRDVHSSYLDISNISNPNVSVQKQRMPDGTLQVTFSTTVNVSQNFNYDLEYINTKFANNIKTTVTAVLEPFGITISNASNYPFTQILNQTTCGGYVICDFMCAESSWNDALQMPQVSDAFGNIKLVNGVLVENITNNWGFQYTSCTSSGDNAVIYYNVIKNNGVVTGKVKVFGDAGNCPPPYTDVYFTSFRFSLINSTLPGLMKTSYLGTYELVSNQLFTSQ